ncbi:MAG: ATP-binding protein [Deltaproteobacteria bacterium]|nr:ATP-binding protein [Deltaproteobacteria bacterium]
MHVLLIEQTLSSIWNLFVGILTWATVLGAVWIVIMAVIIIKKPELGFSLLAAQLKIIRKILSGTGRLLWKGKKALLVLCAFVALLLTTTTLLSGYMWSQGDRLLIALVFSSAATATLVAAAKGKRSLAAKLLASTVILTAAAFAAVTLIVPSVFTVTGVNLTALLQVGGAALAGTLAAGAYVIHQKKTLRENMKKELARELGGNEAFPQSIESRPLCLRVVRIPENYVESLREHSESQLAALRNPAYTPLASTESYTFSGLPQFQRVIRALGGTRVAVRTDYNHGSAEIRLITDSQNLLKLKRILESHVPGLELRVETMRPPPHHERVSVARLEDAVPGSPTPLAPLHDHFIQNTLSGVVYVTLSHPGSLRGLLSTTLMNHTYKQFKKAEKDQDSAISYRDERRMHRMRKTLEEGRVHVGVYAVLYTDQDGVEPSADTLASVLASGFRSDSGSGPARASPQSPATLRKLMGADAGANLKLTGPEAAAVLQFQIPVETRGTRVEKTADFSVSSPGGEEELWLGWLVHGGRVLEERVYLDPEFLSQHVLIGGSTGSGKSTMLTALIEQLWRKGIPTVVIEPSKREHRRLLRLFPVNIFTVGDEAVSPLRLNPLEVPRGVGFESHISSLASIFNYAFDMIPPLPEFFRSSLYECYRSAGWKTASPERGINPCLINLLSAMRRMAESSTYEPKVRMNIESACITRVGDLTLGSLGAMMLGFDSTPFSALRERPTVIELDALGEEEKTLVTSLILLWIHSHLRAEGPTKRLRMVVVVEEAHWIAEDRVATGVEGRSRGALSNLFVSRLLKEARGYGLGVVLVDQNPVRLSEDALKNTNTKIILALPDAGDRQRLGESIGLSQEQIDALVGLERGRCVLWTRGHNPTLIQGRDIEREMTERGLSIAYHTDEEVREHMEPFFRRHPILRWIHPHVHASPGEIYHPRVEEKKPPQKDNNTLVELCKRICSYPTWRKAFDSKKSEEGKEKQILRTARNIAKTHGIPSPELVAQTLREVAKNRKTRGGKQE